MKRVKYIFKKLVEGMEKGKLARVRGLFANTEPKSEPKQPRSNSNDPVLQRATPVENEVVLNAEIVELKLQIEGLKRLLPSPHSHRLFVTLTTSSSINISIRLRVWTFPLRAMNR